MTEYNMLKLRFAFKKQFHAQNRQKKKEIVLQCLSSSGMCLDVSKTQKVAHYEYWAALSSISLLASAKHSQKKADNSDAT